AAWAVRWGWIFWKPPRLCRSTSRRCCGGPPRRMHSELPNRGGADIPVQSSLSRAGGEARMKRQLASLLRQDPAEIQGEYFLVTGMWPVLHLRSFEWVTGPKREGWLVKTVGGLIAAIGTALYFAARRDRVTPEVRKLAIGSVLWLLGVDLYY